MNLQKINIGNKVIIKKGKGVNEHKEQEGIPLEVKKINEDGLISVYTKDKANYWYYTPEDLKKVKETQ